MRADLIKAGLRPATDQHRPEDPQVVVPRAASGKYGGTLHVGFTGSDPGCDGRGVSGPGCIRTGGCLYAYEASGPISEPRESWASR